MNKWKRKALALKAMIEDERGNPHERDNARQALARLVLRFPKAMVYPPLREFTLGDLGRMRNMNVSTDGHWEGRNIYEAMGAMIDDYSRRLAAARVARIERDILGDLLKEIEEGLESVGEALLAPRGFVTSEVKPLEVSP